MGDRVLGEAAVALGRRARRASGALIRLLGPRTQGVQTADGPGSLPDPGHVDLRAGGIDGLYVVHCKALTDRERYLAAALRVCGMDAEWVEAMDWDELPKSLIRERVANDRLTPQEISLFLKHERIFRTILERGQRAALVLEDDVVFPPDLCTRLGESLRALPPGYDLVFLGPSCGLHIELEKGSGFGPATRSRSTCAYLVTAGCCRAILDVPASIDLPIDHHLDKVIAARSLRVWWHEPPLVGQGSEMGAYGHSLGIAWRKSAGPSRPEPSRERRRSNRDDPFPPRVSARSSRFRRTLRSFRSLVGFAVAARALPGDLRRICWRLRRNRQVAGYLATHAVRKLNLGCGAHPVPGWLNTDVEPWDDSVAFLDATEPFRLPSGTFGFIFSEHMIEHLPRLDGLAMLRECVRVLRPGGIIRIATPDLRNLVGLLTEPDGTAQQEYVREVTDRFLPRSRRYRAGLVINNFFRAFGHQFIYDPLTLRDALVDAGLEDVRTAERGLSAHPELVGLERHAEVTGDGIDRFETMVLEAVKPPW